MTLGLADWLREQRTWILPRWAEVIGEHWIQSEYAEPNGAAVLTPPKLDLDPIYDGLISGAEGDYAPLQKALGQLQHYSPRADLPALLEFATYFRRLVFEVLHTEPRHDQAFELLAASDVLHNQATIILARLWSEHIDSIIREREFIAESLDAASADADQRALQLKSLNEVSQLLSSSLDQRQILDVVVSSLQRLTHALHVALWQIDQEEIDGAQVTVLRAMRTFGSEAMPVTGSIQPLYESETLIVRAFTNRTPLFESAGSDNRWIQPDCSVLALPMISSDEAIGVVTLQAVGGPQILRQNQDVAQGVITQATIALQNARLYGEVRTLNVDLERRVQERTRQLQEEKERLALIHEISAEANSVLDLDSMLKTSLAMLSDKMEAEHASVMLVEEEENLLVTRAVLGPHSENTYTRFAFGTGIAGWVAQNRKPLLISDLSLDSRWVMLPGNNRRRREGSMIAAPITFQGNVLGVLTLSHSQNDFFHEDHLRLVNAVVGAIATGINNANLYMWINSEAERRAELLERQQKETSQTTAILQSLADGVIVSDTTGSVLLVNPGAAQIFNREVVELVIWNLNDMIQYYLGPRSGEIPVNDLFARPTNSDGSPRIFETTVRVERRLVSLTLGPVLSDNGELLGALLVARDITREMEADRLKVEFIGTMSHELRTPMTAIKGFTQLLSMGSIGPLNDTQREFVSTIHQNTERMIALINDVLDITKIESGSVDLELRSLHLAEALSGVIAEIQPGISGRNHTLAMRLPPGLPLVRADANRIHQVFYNLLLNAVKYTPKGGEIVIEATEITSQQVPVGLREGLRADARLVLIKVRDTGVGINEEDLPRIFDRFYRTENPLKIEAGGTGLGLSLVKPLVGIMGGRIWVESELGAGSTFYVVFPTT